VNNEQRKMVLERYDEKSPPTHSVPPWASHNPRNPGEFRSYRISPNAKCHCGSGKKFKRCCSYIAPPAEDPKAAEETTPEHAGQ
jgi:hypothetical protein